MRSYPSLGWLLAIAIFSLASPILTSCKSKNVSELKVTDAQRGTFKRCIVSTIMTSFSRPTPDAKAVENFAETMVHRAPSANETAIDPAFEEYASALGCDPKKVDSKNNVGTKIVVEWMISPLNPANAKSGIAVQ